MNQYQLDWIIYRQATSWVSCTRWISLALSHRDFYLISGNITYRNLFLFDHRLGIQLEVASKYLLPGLLAETTIQIRLLLNQGYVFWKSLEWGVQSAYWLLDNSFPNNCHPIIACRRVHIGGIYVSRAPHLVHVSFWMTILILFGSIFWEEYCNERQPSDPSSWSWISFSVASKKESLSYSFTDPQNVKVLFVFMSVE